MVAQSSGSSSPLHADFKNNPKKTIKKLIEAKQVRRGARAPAPGAAPAPRWHGVFRAGPHKGAGCGVQRPQDAARVPLRGLPLRARFCACVTVLGACSRHAMWRRRRCWSHVQVPCCGVSCRRPVRWPAPHRADRAFFALSVVVVMQLAEDPEIIARFLLHTPGLDDAALGDYVGDGDEMCSKVLTCYVSTFNFKGLGFDDALRKFLSAFRLPGEAQRIERIMDAFSAQFYANNPSSFRHADTAFKLAYSVIMLNTDAHNPAIKASRKMTKEQFVRNNRGLDDGHDLPQEFLETM